MNGGKDEHVARKLANARKTLEEVDILIQIGLWNTAVNRLYYSGFYAVSALLNSIDLHPKTHKGTEQLFDLHFVKAGIISKEVSRYFTVLMSMRHNADYESEIEYTEEDVLRMQKPIADLIAEIEAVLAKDQESNK